MEYNLMIISILLLIFLSARMIKLEGHLKRMQYSLDQLAKQSGLPDNHIDDELRRLIEEGEDVRAVKLAREALGLSLLEGKEYIDKLKLGE